MDLTKFNKLKQELEDAKAAQTRKEGERDSILKRLKDVWHVNDLKEADALLEKLKDEEQVALERFEKAMKAFEEKWESSADIKS